ncbi:hypothetical protein [Niallia taxi]|uniref:hypothetical protein n=1 Tax=Niallia taxi TaxID=2499688 RepID=UPI00300BADC1
MIKIERDKALIEKFKESHLEYFVETKPNRKSKSKSKTHNSSHPTYKEILLDIPTHLKICERDFLRFIGKNYRSILIGSPKRLESIRLIIERKFSLELRTSIADKDSAIHQHIVRIFNYKSFIGRVAHKWGAYQLTTELGVNVCPYCNRQFITTYHSDEGKTRPALDHFYDKATYPYFSISLFNLIPCCSVCNSSFKGKDEFTVTDNIHPYIEGFDEALAFSAGFEKINVNDEKFDIDSFLGAGKNYAIKLVETDLVAADKLGILSEKVRKGLNNADAFKLEAIYETHQEYIRDLIKKAIYYNEARLKDIIETHKGLFNSKEEVLSWVLGLDSNIDDFEKRILSKFIFDIANELGITRYIK